ncbi:MAG: hypothetical protein H0T62_10420 [Parachlamydiaceae bacterium]|nr:hypothetical protein [Parachlamydiaceae bacterium]
MLSISSREPISEPIRVKIVVNETHMLTAPTKLFIELPLIEISPLNCESSLQNVACLSPKRISPHRKQSGENHHEEKNGKECKLSSPRDLTNNGKDHSKISPRASSNVMEFTKSSPREITRNGKGYSKTSPRNINSNALKHTSSCPEIMCSEDEEKKKARRLSRSYPKELIAEGKEVTKKIQGQAHNSVGRETTETNNTNPSLKQEKISPRSFQSYSPPQVQRKEHSIFRKISDDSITPKEKLDQNFTLHWDKSRDEIKAIACSADIISNIADIIIRKEIDQ